MTQNLFLGHNIPETMTPASRKIPRQVARELLRHVSRKGSDSKPKPQSQQQLWMVVSMVGVTLSIPLLCVNWVGNLTQRDEALTAAQIRRGAFVNSGSHDAGRDLNWVQGEYQTPQELLQLMEKDKLETDLGAEYMKREE